MFRIDQISFSNAQTNCDSEFYISELWFVGNKVKGLISKWRYQESKVRQIFWKTNISYLLGVRSVRFSENLVCFTFLLPPFWDSPFCSITDEFTWIIIGKFEYKISKGFKVCKPVLFKGLVWNDCEFSNKRRLSFKISLDSWWQLGPV